MTGMFLLAKAEAVFHRVDVMKSVGKAVLISDIKNLRTRSHGTSLEYGRENYLRQELNRYERSAHISSVGISVMEETMEGL